MLGESIEFNQLQPGDLIFIEATYYSKYARAFAHNIVHVEIFTGQGYSGEGTIAARWFRGVVGEFETYKFESKNYYNQRYHFKSINSWLEGVLKYFVLDDFF